ncbi:hypothetical protein EEB18_020495 [Sphingopyxis sp. OPL5]|uniref:hypothetical protein n=1 Tax=Sphingopyxis sp. OPL5 TaxID=2486273 RepID=UPI00164DB4A4|nr:hypothetical protein [Sphingopyxis sp. OPL5]QNO27064.1 hypothetical protein EEB18_020495 [Sphingopyxis sp. OPL5]
MTAQKPFWTIGKEREKAHAAKFIPQEDQQDLIFPVIDAALDINDGHGNEGMFRELARTAFVSGKSAVWQAAANWLRKVGGLKPTVLDLWDELGAHSDWTIRWRVACVLYADIPEPKSDLVFGVLRHDKSAKVRRYAVDRYENRPGPDRNVVFKMFDAGDSSSPGFRRG